MKDLDKYFLSEDKPGDPVPERFDDNPFSGPEEPAPPEASFDEMREFFRYNLENYFAENQDKLSELSTEHPEMAGLSPENYAKTFGEIMTHAWQSSSLGLLSRKKLPDQKLTPDIGVMSEIAHGLGEVVGDLPVTLWGGATGWLAGGGAGAASGPGAGITAMLGAEMGANMAPAVVKQIYMDMLERGEVTSWDEFITRAQNVLWTSLKSGAVGAASFGTGQVTKAIAAPIAKKWIAGQAAKKIGEKSAVVGEKAAFDSASLAIRNVAKHPFVRGTQLTSEIAVMSAMPKLLEGQMPSARDFVVGAATVLAAKSVMHVGGLGAAPVASKLQRIVKANPNLPLSAIIEDTQKDPMILQSVLSEDPEIPKAYQADASAPEPSKFERRIAPRPELLEPLLPELEKEIGDEDQRFIYRAQDERGSILGAKKDGKLYDAYGKEIDADAQNILSSIGLKDDKSLLDTLSDLPEKAVEETVRQVLDEARPLAKMDMDLAQGKKPDILRSTHDLYMRQLSAGKADSWIRYGVEDYDTGERVTRGLLEIYKPHKKDSRRLKAYRVSARAVELDAQGKDVPVDLEAAKRIYERDKKEFDAVHKELVAYNNAKMRYLGKALGWPDDMIQAFEEMGQNYVSFRRLFDDEDSGQKGLRPSLLSPVKKLKGSKEFQLMDPVHSDIENAVVVAQLAARNEMAKVGLENVNAYLDRVDPQYDKNGNQIPHTDGAPGLIEVINEKIPIKISKQVTEFMADHGILETYLNESSKFKGKKALQNLSGFAKALEELTIWRNKNNSLSELQSVVWINGERKILQFGSKEIAALYRGGDHPALNIFQRLARPFTKALTVGATVNPSFITRNPLMDMLTAWLKADKWTDAIPAVTQFRGLYHELFYPLFHEGKTSPVKMDWMAEAGPMTSAEDVIKKHIRDIGYERKPGVAAASARGMRQVIRNLWDFGIFLRDTTEASTRLGVGAAVRRRETKGGKVPITKEGRARVGMVPKNSTINYQEQGATVRGMNSSVGFFSVHFKSLEAGIKPLVEHPERLATRVLPIMSAFIAHSLATRKHPQVESANDYEKINYCIIPSDKWEPATKNDFPLGVFEQEGVTRRANTGGYGGMEINRGKPWKIKIPDTLIPFTSMPANIINKIADDKPEWGKQLFKDIGGPMYDTLVPDVAPTALKPLFEISRNHNDFTGHQIIPESRMRLAPYLRYQPYTSEVAKGIALGINETALRMGFDSTDVPDFAAPANIDHLVTGWTAGLGKLVLDTSDAALRSLGLTPKRVGENPEVEWSDLPVVNAWVRKFPSFSPSYTKVIYERYEKTRINIATFKELAEKHRDPVAARAFINSLEKNDLQQVTRYKNVLTDIRQIIQNTHDHPKLKGYEKTQLINGYLYYLNYVSKRAADLIEKLDRDVRDGRKHYNIK